MIAIASRVDVFYLLCNNHPLMAHFVALPLLCLALLRQAACKQAQSKMYVGSMLGVTCSISVSTSQDLAMVI